MSYSTIIGWILSIFLYVSILFITFFSINSNIEKNIKYTVHKKNLLNVTLVERKIKKNIVKKKAKVVKKKVTAEPKKLHVVKEVQKTIENPKKIIVKKPELKKLFDKIDLTDLPEVKKVRKVKTRKKFEKKDIQEITQKEIAKKITKSLEFEQPQRLVDSQSNGVYDEYKGKVSDILDKYWQETIDTVSGNKAEVIIGIDKLGNFSYKIDTLSYNDAFNAKLRDFLEEMKNISFPPYSESPLFNMKVVFKDILE